MTVSAYADLETDLASGRLAEVIADIAEAAAGLASRAARETAPPSSR